MSIFIHRDGQHAAWSVDDAVARNFAMSRVRSHETALSYLDRSRTDGYGFSLFVIDRRKTATRGLCTLQYTVDRRCTFVLDWPFSDRHQVPGIHWLV